MSSTVTPKKKKNAGASGLSGKLGLITLIAGIAVIVLVIVLVRTCDTGRDTPSDTTVPGIYKLSSLVSPEDGVERKVKEYYQAYTSQGYTVEDFIVIELREDGTFLFETDFDMMVSFEGTYKLDGEKIVMSAQEYDYPMEGTLSEGYLTLEDSTGSVMKFVKSGK